MLETKILDGVNILNINTMKKNCFKELQSSEREKMKLKSLKRKGNTHDCIETKL